MLFKTVKNLFKSLKTITLLTRGALIENNIFLFFHRITPAYAGNTWTYNLNQRRVKDHPCLRGEHKRMLRGDSPVYGSPLLTRGTQGKKKACSYGIRITPAYAGNTSTTKVYANSELGSPLLTRGTLAIFHGTSACSRDHPCLRREHAVNVLPTPPLIGSPLLMRGTLVAGSLNTTL